VPSRISRGTVRAAATSPCAPAVSGPTAVSPPSSDATTCSPGVKPCPVNTIEVPAVTAADSSPTRTAPAAGTAAAVGAAAAAKETGVNVSLFAFFTPCAPIVMMPQVTARQSTSEIRPSRSWLSNTAPGITRVTDHAPSAPTTPFAELSVWLPGKARNR